MKNFLSILLIFCFQTPIHSESLDQLILEPGFNISIYSKNLDAPRQMAESKEGTIFVGEKGGQVVALRDTDNNGQADFKRIIAKNLTLSTGVSIYNGDLYFF